MYSIKERTMWFIGRGRLENEVHLGYKGFIYSLDGEVLFHRGESKDLTEFNLNLKLDKPMSIGKGYILGKMGCRD